MHYKSQASQTYIYASFQDDFVQTHNQDFELPEHYAWIRDTSAWRRLLSHVLYGIAYGFGKLYLWGHLRWHIENCEAYYETLRAPRDQATDQATDHADAGYVLYCNHTQPMGDAFAPALAAWPRRVYVVVSPANLGIPVLGKLLPLLGALPIPNSYADMKRFLAAITQRLNEGAVIVVYPEAHVWPYYTGIRPFPATSFAFAADNHVPAYCMTTTYRRRPHGEKPAVTAYMDGPFYASANVSKRQARQELHDQVYAAMRHRAEMSTYEYVRYEQGDKAGKMPTAPTPSTPSKASNASKGACRR